MYGCGCVQSWEQGHLQPFLQEPHCLLTRKRKWERSEKTFLGMQFSCVTTATEEKIKKSYLDTSPKWNKLLKCLRKTANPVTLRGFGERKEARNPPISTTLQVFYHWGQAGSLRKLSSKLRHMHCLRLRLRKKSRRLSSSLSPWLTRTWKQARAVVEGQEQGETSSLKNRLTGRA